MSIITVAKDQAGDLLRRRYLLVILIGCLALIGMWIGYLALMKSLFGMAQKAPGYSGPSQSTAQGKEMMELMIGGLQVMLHGLVGAIATLLALGLMCFSVRSEISRGTIRMILSRPVRRYEFFLGKWLGCVFIVFVYALLMGILVSTYTYFAFGKLQALVPISLAMLFLKAVTVGSVGMALSMLMRPILALLIAYLAAAETFLFIANFVHGIVKGIMHFFFYLLPSYKAFDMYGSIMSGVSLSGTEIGYRVAYAVLLSAVMLLIGAAVFQRKDLI